MLEWFDEHGLERWETITTLTADQIARYMKPGDSWRSTQATYTTLQRAAVPCGQDGNCRWELLGYVDLQKRVGGRMQFTSCYK